MLVNRSACFVALKYFSVVSAIALSTCPFISRENSSSTVFCADCSFRTLYCHSIMELLTSLCAIFRSHTSLVTLVAKLLRRESSFTIERGACLMVHESLLADISAMTRVYRSRVCLKCDRVSFRTHIGSTVL